MTEASCLDFAFWEGDEDDPAFFPLCLPPPASKCRGTLCHLRQERRNLSVKQIDALVRFSSSSCSPVVPVLPPHGRAHRLEVRLAAETPDVPQLDGLVLAVGDEVATVSPAGQFTLVFAISPIRHDFVMRFCLTDDVNVTHPLDRCM